MQFAFVTLYVGDLEKSLAFYRDLLGLEQLRRQSTEDGELAFVGIGGQPTIELIQSTRFANNTFTGFSIGIQVDSLAAATELLVNAGHPLKRGPISPAPTVRFSFFAGPNGEEIQLIELG